MQANRNCCNGSRVAPFSSALVGNHPFSPVVRQHGVEQGSPHVQNRQSCNESLAPTFIDKLGEDGEPEGSCQAGSLERVKLDNELSNLSCAGADAAAGRLAGADAAAAGLS